jgi:hypothetical protein
MNRRELFEGVAAVAAASGVGVKGHSAPATRPAFVVFECDGQLSNETSERMCHVWEELIRGTSMQGVKALVLTSGLRLTFINESGQVLNRAISNDEPIGVTHLRSAPDA